MHNARYCFSEEFLGSRWKLPLELARVQVSGWYFSETSGSRRIFYERQDFFCCVWLVTFIIYTKSFMFFDVSDVFTFTWPYQIKIFIHHILSKRWKDKNLFTNHLLTNTIVCCRLHTNQQKTIIVLIFHENSVNRLIPYTCTLRFLDWPLGLKVCIIRLTQCTNTTLYIALRIAHRLAAYYSNTNREV